MHIIYKICLLILFSNYIQGFNYYKPIVLRSSSKLYSEGDSPKTALIKAILKFGRTATIITTANDVANFSRNYDSVGDDIKAYLSNNIDVVNPKDYTETIAAEGNEWSFTQFIQNIEGEKINGISIDKDGLFALVIDKINHGNIDPCDIHYVSLIPSYTQSLIDLILKYKIPLDFI